MMALGWQVGWFVVGAPAAVADAVVAAGGDSDGFPVEIGCSWMLVSRNFQKLAGNFDVLKIYSH